MQHSALTKYPQVQAFFDIRQKVASGQTEDLTILEIGYYCRVNDMIDRVLKECAELQEILESDRENALGYNTVHLLQSLS